MVVVQPRIRVIMLGEIACGVRHGDRVEVGAGAHPIGHGVAGVGEVVRAGLDHRGWVQPAVVVADPKQDVAGFEAAAAIDAGSVPANPFDVVARIGSTPARCRCRPAGLVLRGGV